jgi:hypothetical protein
MKRKRKKKRKEKEKEMRRIGKKRNYKRNYYTRTWNRAAASEIFPRLAPARTYSPWLPRSLFGAMIGSSRSDPMVSADRRPQVNCRTKKASTF